MKLLPLLTASLMLAGASVTAAPRAPAEPLAGVVKRVADGDSLWLDRPGQPPLEVRLAQIDAPELCQPWGPEAKAALEALVLNQSVRLRAQGTDRYGRMLGRLFVGELEVGERLVRDGHAWSARGRSGRGPLLSQERMALALRRGLHAEAGALLPEEFRRRHGPCPGAMPGR